MTKEQTEKLATGVFKEWRAVVYVVGLIVALAVSIALADECNSRQDKTLQDHEERLRSVEEVAPAIDAIEDDIDEIQEDIDSLTEFILQGSER